MLLAFYLFRKTKSSDEIGFSTQMEDSVKNLKSMEAYNRRKAGVPSHV